MKRTLWFIFFLLNSLFYLYADSENDSLLKVLDKVISERLIYTQKKEATIKELKKKKVGLNSLEDIYNLNKEIIHQYETFVCDSAEQYIHENIDIAKTIGNKEYLLEEQLRLAFVYSLSGLFIQANDIFKSIKCADLPDHLKALYCWNRIRYYENLIKYTDDVRFSNEYISEKEAYRDTVMSILFDQSDEYRKEKAVKLQDKGSTKEALLILTEIYDKQEPASHGYAMMAMGLGEMLGFRIPRNFRHPYMATSVTDFWRRWHMTLGSWFRDYVYIPLGGSRCSKGKMIRNLLVVWLLTGLWHGAGWNFLLWGFLLFVLVAVEKLCLLKVFRRVPILGHVYMILAIPLSWLIFAISDPGQIWIYVQRLFPFLAAAGRFSWFAGDYLKYGKMYLITLLAGMILITPLPRKLYERYKGSMWSALVLILIFWFSVYCIWIGQDDPFMYFAF